MTVFLIPFAGGSAYAFRPLVQSLSGAVRCVPVELPGRGARAREPLAPDFETLAADVTARVSADVAAHPGVPFVLFGHSMGAMLAWLVARALRRARAPGPRHLLVSGSTGRPATVRGDAPP